MCDIQFLGCLRMCYAMTDLKAFLKFAPVVVAKKWRRINLPAFRHCSHEEGTVINERHPVLFKRDLSRAVHSGYFVEKKRELCAGNGIGIGLY